MMKIQLLIKQTLGLYLLELVNLQLKLSQCQSDASTMLGQNACESVLADVKRLRDLSCQLATQTASAETNDATIEWLQVTLPSLRQSLQPFQALLETTHSTVDSQQLKPLTRNTLWQKCFQTPPHVLLLASHSLEQQSQIEAACVATQLACVFLPTGLSETPSNWLMIAEAYANELINGSSGAQTFVQQSARHYNALCAVIALRLAGPAYYAKRLLLNLYNNELETALSLAPVLFDALNRYSLGTKDLLLLNQGLDNLRNDSNTSTLSEAERRQVYELAENLLPDRFAFNEKQLEQCNRLLPRLRTGVLISALPQPHHPEVLQASLDELGEIEPIGPLLDQFTEQPASAVQILTTGTFYELEQITTWVNPLLEDEAHAWTTFEAAQNQHTALLKRSLNIAQIHESLAASTAAEEASQAAMALT